MEKARGGGPLEPPPLVCQARSSPATVSLPGVPGREVAGRAASPPCGRPLLGSSGLLRSALCEVASTLVGPSGAPRVNAVVLPRRPPSVELGFTPPWSRSPPEFLTSSRPSDPLGPEPTPTRSSTPSTTSPGPAPCARSLARAAGRPPRRGSALRRSQPPSGFLARPGSTAFFHAAAAPGSHPSELCSSPRSAPLSGPPCSLAVLRRASVVCRCPSRAARPSLAWRVEAEASTPPGSRAPLRSLRRDTGSRPAARGPVTPGFTDARASRRVCLAPRRG